MATSFNDLFEGPLVSDPELESDEGVDSAGAIGTVVVIVAVVFVLGVAAFIWWPSGAADTEIWLRGPKVGQLQPGANVMLQDVEVGVVQSVAIEEGRPVALLNLNDGMATEIPDNSRFVVGSLNSVLPGNIGVKILLPDEAIPGPEAGRMLGDVDDGSSGRRRLVGAREVQADESMLPASIPIGTYLFVGMIVLVVAVGFGISWKIACSSWFPYVALAVAVGTTGLLFAKGVISVDDVRNWIDAAGQMLHDHGPGEGTDATTSEMVLVKQVAKSLST